MNPDTPTSGTPQRGFTRWIWLGLGILLVPVCVLGIFAFCLLTLSADASVLRREVAAATRTVWHPRIQLSVGRGMLGVVHTALGFVHDEKFEEARLALAAVRHASVGVYECDSHESNQWSREDLLTRTDVSMERRGWSRLVAVVDDGDMVLIYAKDKFESANQLDLCLTVLNGRELVVVSTKVDAKALNRLIELHHPGGLRSAMTLANGGPNY